MSITSMAQSGLNYAGKLIFDNDFTSTVTSSIKNLRTQKKAGQYTKGIKDMVIDSFKKADSTTSKNIWASLKTSVTSYINDVKNLWKTPDTGILKKLGGTFKGLGKRLPLVGAALTIAWELPNIIRATKDGGLVNGVIETAKAGTCLASGMAFGAVAAGFLGPLGALGGFIVGNWVGKLIVGKSHTEKIDEAKEQQLAQKQQLEQFGAMFNKTSQV